jgi:MFS family permease
MNTHHAPAGTIRAALRYPAFRWLLSGLAVSQLGDWLYNLALVALVYERTHSALWAGITTAARVVPIVVLGPLGGVVADRFDRRRVMIVSDLARVALMLLLTAFAVARLPIVLAPVVAAAATAFAAPYLPCVAAITPRLVEDADLPGANAARSAVNGIGIILGPALSGVLLLIGSSTLAFLLNAATFGLSALTVLAIPALAVQCTRAAASRPGLLAEVAAGAAVLRAHPQALRLVGADIMCSLLYGMQTVLLLLVSRWLGLGTHGYGYLFSGIGVGALVGTALASRAARCPHPRLVLAAALAAVGLPMPLLVVVHRPAVAIALMAVTGTGAILVEILTETGLQRMLPEDVFGRAYGLALPASIAGIVAGSLLAPVLVGVLGGAGALIAAGTLVLAYPVLVLRRTPALAPATEPGLATEPVLVTEGVPASQLGPAAEPGLVAEHMLAAAES